MDNFLIECENELKDVFKKYEDICYLNSKKVSLGSDGEADE